MFDGKMLSKQHYSYNIELDLVYQVFFYNIYDQGISPQTLHLCNLYGMIEKKKIFDNGYIGINDSNRI